MLVALSRHVSLSRTPLASSSRAVPTGFLCAQFPRTDERRAFSHTSPRAAEQEEGGVSIEDAEEVEEDDRPERSSGDQLRRSDPRFNAWLQSVGSRWRTDTQPRNWMGSKGAPFPMNATFKPPTPVSDELRTRVYKEFMAAKDPRQAFSDLVSKYHISRARLDAILRLKGLEAHMVKNNQPLQTGFVAGMEHILGVNDDARLRKEYAPAGHLETQDVERRNTHSADEQDASESEDMKRARLRYQRQFWEAVPEDRLEPQMPMALERARADAIRYDERERRHRDEVAHAASRGGAKQQDLVLPSGTAPNRPLIHFKDIGSKLLNVRDEEKRQKLIKRRQKAQTAS